MTLPASGEISISQVSVELGRASTTTTSLDESAVRTLAGVPSGAISMSNLWGKSSAPPGFVRLLGGTGSDVGNGISLDNSGNFYITGYSTSAGGAGVDDIIIAKYNSSSVIQWQRSLGGTGSDVGTGIAVDSSGNCYIGAYSNTGTNDDIIIAKYNTNGVIQWQRSLGDDAYSDRGGGIAVDSSGNSYITGYSTSTGGPGGIDIIIAKYNTNGVIQWQRSLGGSSNDQGFGIAVDSSGNIYIVGYSASTGGSGSNDIIIAKYNTSGVIQWQRSLGGFSDDTGRGIAVDSSGNCYIVGHSGPGGAGDNIIIAKYNTSGVIQWQRSLGGSGAERAYGIAVDGSGNSYIVGYSASTGGAGNDDILIAKYNTSGVIQWQRSLGGAGTERAYGIAVDGSGNSYITGSANSAGSTGNNDILIAKIDTNGNCIDTSSAVNGWQYKLRTLTDQAGTLTDRARTLTDQARTLTDQARTLTDQARSLTDKALVP